MNSIAKKILILSANPIDTARLRLDEEVREIQAGLERSQYRDRFEIVTKWAVRANDLRRALLDCEPQIVHFSGHGHGVDGLALEGNDKKLQVVSTDALQKFFKLFQGKIECVLLNACYSEAQAEAIYQSVGCVVGMNQAIGDRAAVEFAIGFYDALGADRSYEDAYEFGCSAIDLQRIPESTTPVLKSRNKPTQEPTPPPTSKKRIFISYKRNSEPDVSVTEQIFQALNQQHQVFIDQTMTIGTRWAEQIEVEIQQSDFIIVLLSAQSIHSEMLTTEIKRAHNLAEEQNGHPMILPIRLAYQEPFFYPLSTYLNHINWFNWENPEDTPQLIDELMRAIASGSSFSRIKRFSLKQKTLLMRAIACGSNFTQPQTKQPKTELSQISRSSSLPRPFPSAQPMSLEMPEGTMNSESAFYVERSSDPIALETIRKQGVTITIKGPRQMGKSSLLIRIIETARYVGKQVAFLDFQLFEKAALSNADIFFRQFCIWLTEELELTNKVDEYWISPLGNSQCCTRYIGRYLLKELGKPLVLGMDEVERLFDTDFRSDFFGMLRSWHNNRATTPIWKQLDLTLVTSTEPYHLIDNLNQSPFNVGQVLELEDFTSSQVAHLNQRHNSPLNPREEEQLIGLLKGHPYLVRLALYLVASHRLSTTEIFTTATADNGPFNNHLRNHLFRLHSKPELVQGMLQVIRQNTCEDESIFFRLRGAGLVRREGRTVLPRCQLYSNFFQEHLRG